MKSSATSPTRNSSVTGATLSSAGKDVQNFIDLLEARRAAEKAYDVAKVDERVNRAVVAANRATNAARLAALGCAETNASQCEHTEH
ncbi:hypothetical protein PIB30_071257 [Stylosanthes scabra]|uniref:Uncharacterized protein n=1 Tax=Stylosanthes scabra TaxID=79078 RepID=A0ABU6QPR7_9FABA|nr:hypothetical protein [Stylosanthes scabra]